MRYPLAALATALLFSRDGIAMPRSAADNVRGPVPAVSSPPGPAYLVKDIATGAPIPVPYGTFGQSGTVSGSFAYFIGQEAATGSIGSQLWRTDGTVAGTAMVASLNSGHGISSFDDLTDLAGVLFFLDSYDLWRSDGSASGTTRIKSFPQNGFLPTDLTAVGGTLYFEANDGSGPGLWRSDGTPSGTVLVRSFEFIVSMAAVGGTLFLVADDGVNGKELWKSDGTPAGTSMIVDLCPGDCSFFVEPRLTASGGRLYFVAQGGAPERLFTTDGTAAGTVALTPPDSWTIRSLTDVGGTLFFVNGTDVGEEPWKSDGTAAGTVLVKDVSPGGSSQPSDLTNVNGTLYFVADDGVHGRELWRSDGTDLGTVMVLDITPGTGGFGPRALSATGNTLFLFADDGADGYELWKSDGSAAGTTLVKDICPGPCDGADGNAAPGVALPGTRLLFVADDGLRPSFWVTDGTAAGTLRLGHTANATAWIGNILAVGPAVYFGVGDFLNQGAWRSNGTAADTIRLASEPAVEFVEAGGTVFFSSASGGIWSLYRTDGTPEGTTVLLTGVYGLHSLTPLNGTLLFVASTISEGEELWRSDGTAGGTQMVADVRPGPAGSAPSALAKVGDHIFFQAYGPPDTGLWKTDGTAAGTVLVKAPLLASEIVDVGGIAFFAGYDGFRTGDGAGLELWRSDGTLEGTFLLKDMSPGPNGSQLRLLTDVEGRLFFVAFTTDSAPELWTSDGTTAGTRQVKDIMPGPEGSYPLLLRNVEGTLLFFAHDGVHGRELWRSDGTEVGTVMVKDIAPGPDSSVAGGDYPDIGISAAAWGGILYFGGWTQASGRELWRTDGTSAGTVPVQDIAPGASSSNPDPITFAGSLAFFGAYDGVHGAELWAMPLVTPSLSIEDAETYEGDSGATPLPFRVTLWPPTGQTVSVDYATRDGSARAGLDYTATSGTLTFAPAATEATLDVPVFSDAVDEPDEFLEVDLLAPTNAVAGRPRGTGRIRDGSSPVADLAITKTDGQDAARPGQTVTYTIVARNNGPGTANGARVTDTVPPELTAVTWTCVGANGTTCTPSGSGDIDDTVDLPVGGSVTYTLTGTVAPNASRLANTAMVHAAAGMSDPTTENNAAADNDTIVCAADTAVIVADGRLTSSVVAAGATAWFGSTLKIGDSYSLAFENLSESGPPPGTVTVFAGDDACSGPSSVTTRDTSVIDPAGDPASRRVSFTAAGTATFFRVRLENGSGSAIPYRVSLSDTALYSPAWSTNGSFDTFYSFQNTTGATVNGVLTFVDTAGSPVATTTLSIPAGQAASTNTLALGVDRNRTGTARFTHDGPPGAVVAEAAITNFNLNPAYVQPVKFQTTRQRR